MPKAQQQNVQVGKKIMTTVIEIVLSGGHGEGLQIEGDGREEHA